MTLLLALAEDDKAQLVYWFFGALIVIGQGLQGWVAVMTYMDRKKVDPAQYVTKAELAAIRTERDHQIQQHFSAIQASLEDFKNTMARYFDQQSEVNKTVTEDVKILNRMVGELEGATQHKPAPRRR